MVRRSSGEFVSTRSDQTVVFDDVIYNVGDAYDATSGNFTAPYRGVYPTQLWYTNHDEESGERACRDPCLAVAITLKNGTSGPVLKEPWNAWFENQRPNAAGIFGDVFLDVGDVVNVRTLRRDVNSSAPQRHVIGKDNLFHVRLWWEWPEPQN